MFNLTFLPCHLAEEKAVKALEDGVGVYSRNRELKWVRSKMSFLLGSKTLLVWCQLLCSSPHLSQSLCGEIYMIHIMQPHEVKRSFTLSVGLL